MKKSTCHLHDSTLYKCSKCNMVHCKKCEYYPCGDKAKTFIFKLKKGKK